MKILLTISIKMIVVCKIISSKKIFSLINAPTKPKSWQRPLISKHRTIYYFKLIQDQMRLGPRMLSYLGHKEN